MKYTALLAALAALLLANQSANAQGALTPPGAPAESQKSLQEIYDAIQSLKTELDGVVQVLPFVKNMVAVYGGQIPLNSDLAAQQVATFYIGKYEITWGDWQAVALWASSRGYTDLAEVGSSTAVDHPVPVNWYDALKWCNALSEKEGLEPVYQLNGVTYKIGQSEPSVNQTANGYRLPTEAEWEWAARGGISSQGFIYSGSDDLDKVAWFDLNNQTNTTKPIAKKFPNELGLYDMSGNLVEWCWDNSSEPAVRIPRGGAHGSPEGHCNVAFRGSTHAINRGPIGFRIARNN
jgi:sulfatase modifying factor 1